MGDCAADADVRPAYCRQDTAATVSTRTSGSTYATGVTGEDGISGYTPGEDPPTVDRGYNTDRDSDSDDDRSSQSVSGEVDGPISSSGGSTSLEHGTHLVNAGNRELDPGSGGGLVGEPAEHGVAVEEAGVDENAAAAFSRFSIVSALVGGVSVVLWLAAMYGVHSSQNVCVMNSPEKSWAGLWAFALGYSPNLFFVQLPTALGNAIAVALVTDPERSYTPGAHTPVCLSKRIVRRVFWLTAPRLVLQVVIKYYFVHEVAGGVLMLANLACDYFTPLFWTYEALRKHNRAALPVVFIYVILAFMLFFVLPKLLSRDPANIVHFVAGPAIFTAIECIMMVGISITMNWSNRYGLVWDLHNLSVWSRIIAASFLGLKLAVFANPDIDMRAAVLAGAMALVSEVALRNPPSFVKALCTAGCAPRATDARMARFYNVHIASKKDVVLTPFLCLLTMQLTKRSVFPELLDCPAPGVAPTAGSFQLIPAAVVGWLPILWFAVVCVSSEVLSYLVHAIDGRSGGLEYLYGSATVVKPRNFVQVTSLYIAEAACAMFSWGQAVLLMH